MRCKFTKKFFKSAAAAALLLISVSVAYAGTDRIGEAADGASFTPEENAIVIDVPNEEVARRAAELDELYAAADAETKVLISKAFAEKIKERFDLFVKLHHWKEDSWGRCGLEKLTASVGEKTERQAYKAKSEAVCPADACLEALKEFGEATDSNELRFYGNELIAYALRCDLYEGIKPGAE